MVKEVLKEIADIDNKVINIINYGFFISFIIGIIGTMLIMNYNTYQLNYDLYEGGILLVKAGLTFAAQCFACGFLFDKLKKQ